jgi:sporadic carbohydrate cluster protein (TIGR04323 family)
MHLTSLQKHWNNDTLNYDLEKFNWPKWALNVIQEVAPHIKELETLHKHLKPHEIVKVANYVQAACGRRDFMENFDEFAAEYVPQRIDNKKYMIQRYGTLRVVVPDQAKQNRRLWFHQGIFVGNGRGCRTIWTPFTEARDTNTMWILDLDISREITKKVLKEKWSLDKFEKKCLRHARPVNLSPGQSHLFFQEHLHGNVNNDEGYTRVSLDMRILIEGEEYGRRWPGGFMRLPGDYDSTVNIDYTNKTFVTYASWSSAYSQPIPLPLQRESIEKYCVKNKISYNDYLTDNEFMDWQPALEHYIKLRPDGIVLHSIYCLTDDTKRRQELLELALENQVELHFANELIKLQDKKDLEKIQTYLNFAPAKKDLHVWEH